MMTIEATEKDWQEIYALNDAYRETGDYMEWLSNLFYLCSQNNPLAFHKLEIIAKQRRETDDKQGNWDESQRNKPRLTPTGS